jgi:hypothetical protein
VVFGFSAGKPAGGAYIGRADAYGVSAMMSQR